MHTTRYMTPTATDIVRFPATAAAARTPFPADVQAWRRDISAADVCDLLDAAGSLAMHDIAGGLDAPISQVARFVSSLLGAGDVQQDEFGRYRLAGGCLQQAS